jgi:hypothetical protein
MYLYMYVCVYVCVCVCVWVCVCVCVCVYEGSIAIWRLAQHILPKPIASLRGISQLRSRIHATQGTHSEKSLFTF